MTPATRKKFKGPVFNILSTLPIMLTVILILGLVKYFISFEALSTLFTGQPGLDTFFGSIVGSVMAGNSINSYIIGTEMLSGGLTAYAVTAFLASWVTVGFIQMPVESSHFGIRFTLLRNVLSFGLSMVTAVVVVMVMGVIS